MGTSILAVMARQLTREAYDRLQAELADLESRGRVEIARKIEEARELGDLSENGDYQAAKEEQGRMEARIREIRAMLTDAEIIESDDADGTVRVGSVVEIRFEGDTVTERYLVGTIEERRGDLEVVSPESPLGSRLLDRRPGDTVTYEPPGGGRAVTVEVVSVE